MGGRARNPSAASARRGEASARRRARPPAPRGAHARAAALPRGVLRSRAGAVMKHYALLVESIEASVAHLGETAGLEFRAPARIPFVVAGHGEQYEHDVRACYTVERSVELVET